MTNDLHWIDGPWPGRLALAARPRGGEWLETEFVRWRREGVDTVLSLLTLAEQKSLDLMEESREASAKGIKFLSLPVPDREAPSSRTEFTWQMEEIDRELSSGKNVVVHCRQGIGRSGLVAACLLVSRGWGLRTALERLSGTLGVPVPETEEQRRWIERYAGELARVKSA